MRRVQKVTCETSSSITCAGQTGAYELRHISSQQSAADRVALLHNWHILHSAVLSMKLLETKNSRLHGKLTSYEDHETFEAFLRMSRGFRNGGTVEPAVEACPARFKSRPLLPPVRGRGRTPESSSAKTHCLTSNLG